MSEAWSTGNQSVKVEPSLTTPYADLAAERMRDALANGESQASAPFSRGAGAAKFPEDMALLFRRNAWAGIPDGDAATWCRVLERLGEQIGEDLPEPLAVGLDRREIVPSRDLHVDLSSHRLSVIEVTT